MTKPVSVEIYMTSHRVLGRVDPGTTGLFSFFNLPTSSVIEVEGAHLNRLHQPGRLVSRHTEMWLIKREIVTVLLSSRAELGPMSMVRGGFTTTVPHWLHILLGGYELRGLFEAPGKFIPEQHATFGIGIPCSIQRNGHPQRVFRIKSR